MMPWDIENMVIVRAMARATPRTVRNVLTRYSPDDVQHSDFDRDSIMQYPVDNELTIGDFEIGWNTVLSDMDKAFISRAYPFDDAGGDGNAGGDSDPASGGGGGGFG